MLFGCCGGLIISGPRRQQEEEVAAQQQQQEAEEEQRRQEDERTLQLVRQRSLHELFEAPEPEHGCQITLHFPGALSFVAVIKHQCLVFADGTRRTRRFAMDESMSLCVRCCAGTACSERRPTTSVRDYVEYLRETVSVPEQFDLVQLPKVCCDACASPCLSHAQRALPAETTVEGAQLGARALLYVMNAD